MPNNQGNQHNHANLEDPREKYYTEGFSEKNEDRAKSPALQKDMNPIPDCGESSYEGTGRLEGRRALITGGDSGIGRAAAIAFAREGADVAIHYLAGEEADAEDVKTYIEEAGQKAVLIEGDLRQTGVATQIVERAIEELGGIDILVLNAAQQIASSSLSELSMKQINDTFQVNIISMYEALKAAEDHLEEGSAVITTTSVQATGPSTSLLDYAATKAAISNFTVGMSEYFGEKGVRVNAVAPGPIWTPLQLDDGKLEGDLETFGQTETLERAGQPVELAPVYVFLASKDASYVTGQIYGVTGGTNIDL
ncbi:SDR family oxidoreductase [Aerococcaceae bacterium WGS1372]